MKKILLFMLMATVLGMTAGMTSCNSFDKGSPKEPEVITEKVSKFQADYDGVLPDLSQGADHTIALQRQTMFSLLEGASYYWYETKFSFTDSLKTTTLDDVELMEITSTFQTVNPTLCYTITTNAALGTLVPAPTPGLWIEDFDLSKTEIRLNINDVLQRLKEVNTILPPATSVILRKPVGPQPCNAQYVLGNPLQTLWVDAVTGDVTDWCPAFPRVAVNTPLGEWP